MAGLLLFILALIATVLAFTITVAETAFVYLPRTEAEEIAQEHPHSVFARVLTEASTGNDERYTHPLRLARGLSTGGATSSALRARACRSAGLIALTSLLLSSLVPPRGAAAPAPAERRVGRSRSKSRSSGTAPAAATKAISKEAKAEVGMARMTLARH